MADLISVAYAKRHIAQATYSADETTLVTDLAASVSFAVRMYCNRKFDSQAFDEVYDGQTDSILALAQYPILSVERVAGGRTKVIEATNTSATVQRATIHVTATTCVLRRVSAGATTTNTLTFADADTDTLAELVTKIDTVANGWDARMLDTAYNDRASADLMPQGAFDASDVWAGLYLHLDELDWYLTDYPRGWLRRTYGSFEGGPQEYRVKYTAGFATVPEDVQAACAKWVANLYWAAKTVPAAVSELTTEPPAMVRQLLSCWRKHIV